MGLTMFSLESKLEVVEAMIRAYRDGARARPGSGIDQRYQILKAIAADLRARAALPRSNTLGELERRLVRAKATLNPEIRGYDPGKMIAIAEIVVAKWPTIQQALEQYGEESAE